jgi:hypothetical protein
LETDPAGAAGGDEGDGPGLVAGLDVDPGNAGAFGDTPTMVAVRSPLLDMTNARPQAATVPLGTGTLRGLNDKVYVPFPGQ